MAADEAVAPAIFTPGGREVIRVPWELVSTVDACDAMLRRYGMQMKLVCEHCADNGNPGAYITGNNLRGGSTFLMECGHAMRRYDYSVT
jgi:hypothetical protein